MSRDLTGKVIMITGASSGLGGALAKECSKLGASIILVGRNEERLAAVVQECGMLGAGEVRAYPFDLTRTSAIPGFIEDLEKEWGTIDALINNAGFGLFERLDQTPEKTVATMFEVNVLALISLTKAVIPVMQKHRNGHVINIASQAGKLATPKSSIYSATKHAVIGFSNSMRMEVADEGISITTVNPGPINTSFFEHADSSGTYAASVKRWMLDSDEVAAKTVKVLFTKRRELNLPRWMSVISRIHALFPRLVESVGKKGFNQK
ncbi:SDR family NAD(P)-dependent oxidoreductase [Jeotgalibacillus sp. S-D1]|uniref:SDR family NAD(P)-dependent oxidoreductase n=1 Tax=Jeotgalibacillus sp. S-D1 TaxID=2552189 RepID=UPI0010592270|nr:SDR family NAD(P)-dependent oxidoreductase [Jeotgalibacillus sp. S-D1]TDL34667.1 SDR family NAD(P)-dependent oxidoreductase [Jeotgalibacillus sp. S-D1]